MYEFLHVILKIVITEILGVIKIRTKVRKLRIKITSRYSDYPKHCARTFSLIKLVRPSKSPYQPPLKTSPIHNLNFSNPLHYTLYWMPNTLVPEGLNKPTNHPPPAGTRPPIPKQKTPKADSYYSHPRHLQTQALQQLLSPTPPKSQHSKIKAQLSQKTQCSRVLQR